MTSISSSLPALLPDPLSSQTQVDSSNATATPDPSASQQSSYGPSCTLDISAAGLAYMNGGSGTGGGTPSEIMIMEVSTGPSAYNAQSANASGSSGDASSGNGQDSIIQLIEQMLAAMQSYFQNTQAGSANASANPADPNSSVSAVTAAAGTAGATAVGATGTGSPIDQFLTNLENNPNLTDAQKQSVQNILAQYQDAPATPDTFQQVHDALQQAGIQTGHHGHHHHHGGGAPAQQASTDPTAAATTDPADTTDALLAAATTDTTNTPATST